MIAKVLRKFFHFRRSSHDPQNKLKASSGLQRVNTTGFFVWKLTFVVRIAQVPYLLSVKREEARAKAESRGCGLKKREEARAKAESRGYMPENEKKARAKAESRGSGLKKRKKARAKAESRG